MAGNSNAIKMGRAFVELFVEDNKLYRGLDAAGNKLKSWGATFQKFGGSMAAAGAAGLAPLLASLKEVVGRANEMQLLADRLGEGVSATSALAGGFERAGVGADQFAGIIEGLKTRVEEAADSHGYLLDNLRSMGPAARLSGLEARAQLNAVADAIQRIPRAINQTRAARALGLEGILPQLRRGRAGVDELFKNGAPGTLTAEQGRQAVAVTNAMREAWGDFKDTVRQVGLSLLPTAARIAELKDRFKAGLTAVRDWIKENRGAVVAAAAVGVGIVAAGAAVAGLGITMAVVGKLIILSVVGIKLAFAALLSPLGLVAAGLALVFAQTRLGQSAVAGLRDGFAAVKDRAVESFGAISDAVKGGEFALAWQVGLAAMNVEWQSFVLQLQTVWEGFASAFVDDWEDSIEKVKGFFAGLRAYVEQEMERVNRAAGAGTGLLAGVVGGRSRAGGNFAAGVAGGAGSGEGAAPSGPGAPAGPSD